MAPKIIAIAAMSEERVIGQGNSIPWRLPEDLQRFSKLTTGQAVLMGRKTFESLPARFRPLPGRRNLVATRNAAALQAYAGGIQIVPSVCDYLDRLRGGAEKLDFEILWIIGGEEVYRLTLPYWDEVYLTLVPGEFTGDAFFPEFENGFTQLSAEQGEACRFLRYARTPVNTK